MSGIVSNPQEYFRQMTPERRPLLLEIEAEAAREAIPIVGPVVGELLYILARATRARRILELGTATGYSAIYLAEACGDYAGRVVTWESDPVMAERARANVEKAGLMQQVDVRLGDALEAIAGSTGHFDFIFIDIEKADYARALPYLERLLAIGGLLVADNVAFKDADRFNRLIRQSSAWRSVSLFAFLPEHSPQNDGLCFALRI
jgi:predicted O-methyltransferase YrrM